MKVTMHHHIEHEYEVAASFEPGDPGNSSLLSKPEDCCPPSDSMVEDIVIKWNGSVLDEQERRNHGFTWEVIEEIKTYIEVKANHDAKATALDEPPKRED